MPCNFPIDAYYAKSINPTGKRSLTFSRTSAYSGAGLTQTGLPLERGLIVPCGKCMGCRKDQSLMWAVRGYHESLEHPQNSFITLTYDDEHLPADGKIIKSALQNFFKRLRSSGVKFRYMACGEYGGLTRRPHYHAIIFGKDWLENSTPIKTDLYTNIQLQNSWGLGLVSIAPVTMASICYVVGYVNKKVADSDTFSLMSRRPGIGHNWLTKYKDDLIRTGFVTIEGRQYQIPKRYLEWEDSDLADVKKDRAQFAAKRAKTSDYFVERKKQIARELGLRSNLKSKSILEKM